MKTQKSCVLLQKVFVFTALFFSCLSWASSSQAVSCKSSFSNLNDLAQAVTKNAEFSSSKTHRRLFEIYQNQFLGERNNTEKSLEDVIDIVKHSKHSKHSKPALREQILTLEQRSYEPSQSLKEIVQRLKNSANQFQAQLFQPEANLGFWQRLLFPLKKEELNGLSKQEKQAKQKEHKTKFRKHFNHILTQEDREILKDDSMNTIEKTIAVYRILDRIKSQMVEENRDVQPLSQAMVDLVHTSGFRNPHYLSMLRSQNALDQIKGLEKILNERDTAAIGLNFENHFSELITSLNIDHVTGSTKKENLSQTLSAIQKAIQNTPYTVAGKQVLRVRALSLQESPFRGCLGGDCSTQLYFELALDPNFIYFTLTNEDFQSSGHITVVLGKAYSKKEEKHIKTAFVDKIQNVPQVMILPMLEAIYLSLEELGYHLGLPVEVGDHNGLYGLYGLSNMDNIRTYMDSEVNPLLTHELIEFKPHKNKYNFDKGYSKAYSKPKLLEFERQGGDFKIEPGEIYKKSKIPKKLKVEDLFQEILSLRDSEKEEDQIQFISHLKSLSEIEALSKEFGGYFTDNYLKSKIKEKQTPFKVRKKALYTFIGRQYAGGTTLYLDTKVYWNTRNPLKYSKDQIEPRFQNPLYLITSNFSENEQIAIVGEISNWIFSKTHYKKEFMRWFLYEFVKEHIEKKVQFSFQSIIFNILSKNIKAKELVVELAVELENKKVTKYLFKGITIEKLREFSDFTLFYTLPAFFYMNKIKVHNLRGEDLELFFLFFTDEQKSWVKPEQFKTVSFHRMDNDRKYAFADYIAPLLNRSEVYNMSSHLYYMYLPFLMSKQKNWVNTKVFNELKDYELQKLSGYFNQKIVKSLNKENLESVFPYLIDEQKSWVKPK